MIIRLLMLLGLAKEVALPSPFVAKKKNGSDPRDAPSVAPEYSDEPGVSPAGSADRRFDKVGADRSQ